MKIFKVYPYKRGSRSAKNIALKLNGKVLKREHSNFVPNISTVVINWGSSNVPAYPLGRIVNEFVGFAQCKLKTLEVLKTHLVSTPPFTTNRGAVAATLKFPVVCRTTLKGHSGDGIVIANTENELVEAPLYTEYIKKAEEYRIHAGPNALIFCQRKARKLSVVNPDWQVRNLAGGFVFAEVPIGMIPEGIPSLAMKAVQALDIDFGAVDIIWNEQRQTAYVLEVNTACGLEDRTAVAYANYFIDNFA